MATKRKKTEKRVTYEVEEMWGGEWLLHEESESLADARAVVCGENLSVPRGQHIPMRIVKVTREVVR